MAAYGPVAAERNVTLTATLQHDPTLDADGGRLTQVMFNLVSNAIKFAKASIHVNVCMEDADIGVAVRDDGLGIPPELQDRLFLPFSQLHESSTAANRGNGSGLYISRNIMELHGGTLGCASDGRGQGSTFTLRLPLTTPSATPGALAPAERLQAVAAK